MPPRPADFKLQIIIIGSRGVGKTSLMERYTDDTFCEACKSTVGEDKRRLIIFDNFPVEALNLGSVYLLEDRCQNTYLLGVGDIFSIYSLTILQEQITTDKTSCYMLS